MQLQLPVKALLRQAAQQLAASAVADDAQAEAEWLLAAVLHCPRAHVQAGLAAEPSEAQRAQFLSWVQQRASGLPFAYLSGEQPFRRLSLAVTPDVLIPRPETEQLVDWALALLATRAAAPQVWDVCTGSGCIALALVQEHPRAQVWASDASPAALAVAQANAARCGLVEGERLHFGCADWLQWSEPPAGLDLIVANPPYIADDDPHLPALRHEPVLALVSGADGLDGLRELVSAAPARLAAGGWLLLEHGYDQHEAVQALMRSAGFDAVQSHRDYGGQWRATQGRKPA